MTDQERIVKAAVSWWKGHRPLIWTERMHRYNPSVNTTSSREKRLAVAVARYLEGERAIAHGRKAMSVLAPKGATR